METTPTANNVANNETKTIKATAKTRKPRTTKSKKVAPVKEMVEAKQPKEKVARIQKIDKVQAEICKQFEISENKFLKFCLKYKPAKMNINKFADALVQRAFFDRKKLAEQLKG